MTTAIFSVVNAALLRPLGYPNPQRLVWLNDYDPNIKRSIVGLGDFYKWRLQANAFSAMAAYSYAVATIATAQGAQKVSGVQVGGDFWKMTGARAAFGRLPQPEEQGAIVLSWDLFQRQFAADAHAVGSSVSVDGRSAIVAGVLPKSFRFEFPAWWYSSDPHPSEAYFPLPPPSA